MIGLVSGLQGEQLTPRSGSTMTGRCPVHPGRRLRPLHPRERTTHEYAGVERLDCP